jgi:hypothetical protein
MSARTSGPSPILLRTNAIRQRRGSHASRAWSSEAATAASVQNRGGVWHVGSVANDFMPFALNAQRYAGFLPNAEAIRLDRGEARFVYLDECSAPIEAMGIQICSDRPSVVRGDVHRRLGASVVDFLTRRLHAQAGPPKP